MADRDRRQRIATNEAKFKAFNEGLRDGITGVDPKMQAVCECGRLDCSERLDISDEEWREAHAHPDRYVIAIGHELPEAERVVSSEPRYATVEKNVG